jgi:hypothetical protein
VGGAIAASFLSHLITPSMFPRLYLLIIVLACAWVFTIALTAVAPPPALITLAWKAVVKMGNRYHIAAFVFLPVLILPLCFNIFLYFSCTAEWDHLGDCSQQEGVKGLWNIEVWFAPLELLVFSTFVASFIKAEVHRDKNSGGTYNSHDEEPKTKVATAHWKAATAKLAIEKKLQKKRETQQKQAGCVAFSSNIAKKVQEGPTEDRLTESTPATFDDGLPQNDDRSAVQKNPMYLDKKVATAQLALEKKLQKKLATHSPVCCSFFSSHAFTSLKKACYSTLWNFVVVFMNLVFSARVALSEILRVVITLMVVVIPVFPLVSRSKSDQPFQEVTEGARIRGTVLIFGNQLLHVILMSRHNSMKTHIGYTPLRRTLDRMKAESTKFSKEVKDDMTDTFRRFNQAMSRSHDQVAKDWAQSRPLISASLFWYSISIGAAYGILIDDYDQEYSQAFFQTCIASAAYFAYCAIEGLAFISEINAGLQQCMGTDFDTMVESLLVREVSTVKNRTRRADSHAVVADHQEQLLFVTAMRPIVAARLKRTSLSLVGSTWLTESRMRKGVLALFAPLFVIEFIPQSIISVLQVFFPPLQMLSYLQQQDTHMSFFGDAGI